MATKDNNIYREWLQKIITFVEPPNDLRNFCAVSYFESHR